jgi:2-desacetyl-2-hydroxyethyl bacteriochlorophyllide A dehydrogenase
MSAVYYEGGGRFTVRPAELVEPGPGEARLRVVYGGICGTDLHIAHGAMDARIRTPQVIGHEMSGVVDAIGADVETVAVGDHVVVRPLDTRGETAADKGVSHICRDLKFLGIDTPGAFQSSWTVPAFTLHRLPPGLELRDAALAEPLAVAVHDVRRGHVAPDEDVVVIGGGPIGLMIALVARHAGGTVTIAEINAHRRALAEELGFATVDPSAADLAAVTEERTGGAGADVVFEVSGSTAGAAVMTKLAGLRGRIVVVAIFGGAPPPVNLFDMFWKELTITGARVYEPADYERAIELIASDALPLDRLITSVEPLQRVPELLQTLGGPDATAVKVLVDCQS